eukprot:CAMPEP_0113467020 /NCGR_PEP_ID=MMETSP0014_2-20120614/14590_1 /TAXON_ID=2857 /ORGANISM="Nitzschia sp." /LENGTH=158 /DNA_ID=CAMNT_0000359297 /DNA_START=393 /DNA_END=869 /DNA_ORIENTATION=+ /assembly_acc=CAM_ASM_000159
MTSHLIVAAASSESSGKGGIDERFDLEESGVDPFGLFVRGMDPKKYLLELLSWPEGAFGTLSFLPPDDEEEEEDREQDVVDVQGVLIVTPPAASSSSSSSGTAGTRRLEEEEDPRQDQLGTPSRNQRTAFPTDMPTFVQSDMPSDMPSDTPSGMPVVS